MGKLERLAAGAFSVALGAFLRRSGRGPELISDFLLIAGGIVMGLQAWAAWHASRQKIAPSTLPLRTAAPQPIEGPDIRPMRTFVEERTLKAVDLTGTLTVFPVSTASVLFRNYPTSSHPYADAANVLAQIRFMYKGQTVLDVSPGRWGDSKEPSLVKLSEPGASLTHLNAIPFRIGERHELNVAIKFPGDDFFYAFNNDSYNYTLWRHDGFRLSGDAYEVIVELVGAHLATEHHFLLKNRGPGNGLEFEYITPQD